MPRPYSQDLRTRARRRRWMRASARARRRGGAALPGGACDPVYLWLRQRRDEGRTAPKPARGGPAPVIRGAVADALGRLVEADDDLTLAEYAQALEAEAGVRAAPSMLCRALRRLNRPRKKKTPRAAERDTAEVKRAPAAWRRETLAGITRERLVFIDESAALTNLVRRHGRSPRGRRAHGRASCGKWHRLTVIGALGVEGFVGAMSIEAATSGAVFAAFLERVLLPELRRTKPDAVIVMDNLGAHRTRAVREPLERSGFAYRYLPPYSPDLNPIEPAWAKVKAGLRRAAARSVGALHDAVGAMLDTITAGDAAGCFRYAGYAGV